MKRALVYLLLMLSICILLGLYCICGIFVFCNQTLQLAFYCGLCGGIGGITYCLRGIYLSACVHKKWDNIWLPWYAIRPIVSFICGVVSFLFLKAGLIALEAQQHNSSNWVFYALAFIAGLNVDKFIEKIEDVAQVTWGIKKSRVSEKKDNSIDKENGDQRKEM